MNPLETWTTIFAVFSSLPDANYEAGHGRRLGSSATVTLDPPMISHRGDVTITISDPTLPTSGYCNMTYVALYSPADANINNTVPIRYQSMLDKPSFCATGDGNFTFNLNNIHTGGYAAYVIQASGLIIQPHTGQNTFYKMGPKPFEALDELIPGQGLQGVVLGLSNNVTFMRPNEPTHVRVTTGVGAGNYFVSWNQGDASSGGMLRWSTNPSQSFSGGGTPVAGNSWTCTVDDLCSHGPASTVGFRTLGTQWTVALDLTAFAGQNVYYAVGDSQDNSTTFTFTVPLLPGDNTSFPQRWIMYADQGVGYADDSYNGRNINNGQGSWQITQAVINQVNAATFQAVLVSGDLAYSDGYFGQFEDYLDMIEPFASRIPLLSNVGNHESDWYADHSNITYASPDGSTPTSDFWNLPQPGNPTNNTASSISSGGECGVSTKIWPQGASTPTQPWYTYSAGLLTLVVFSTEHNFTQGSAQYAWLNATLAAVNRTLTPWLVVTGHRPMYTAEAPFFDSAYLIQSIEGLLIQYNVNVYISGHLHWASRTCAMKNYNCVLSSTLNTNDNFNEFVNPSGPVYIVVGAAGATFDTVQPLPNFTEFSMLSTYFYSTVTVVSPQVLEISIIQPNGAGNGVGTAHDNTRISFPSVTGTPTSQPTPATKTPSGAPSQASAAPSHAPSQASGAPSHTPSHTPSHAPSPPSNPATTQVSSSSQLQAGFFCALVGLLLAIAW